MRKLLLAVYDDIKARLGVEVSPEMTSFFDQLLATPEEIDAERRANTSVGEVADEGRMIRDAVRAREKEVSQEPSAGSGGDVLFQGEDAVQALREEGEFLKKKKKDNPLQTEGEPYRPTQQEMQESMQQGQAAMEQVLAEHNDVLNAMYRSDVGDITFLWGEPGGPSGEGGWGISHLIRHRDAQFVNGYSRYDGETVARKMPEVIAKGTMGEPSAHKNKFSGRVQIHYQGYTALLSLYKDQQRQTWLFSGWEDYNAKSSDETGPVYDGGSSTPSGATRFRSKGGAEDTTGTISQEGEFRQRGRQERAVQSLREELAAVNQSIKKAADADELSRLEGVKVDLETQLAFELRDAREAQSAVSATERGIDAVERDERERQLLERQAVGYEIELEDAHSGAKDKIDDLNIRRAIEKRISQLEKQDIRGEERGKRQAQAERHSQKVKDLHALYKKRAETIKTRQEVRKMVKQIRQALRSDSVAWDYRQQIKGLLSGFDLRRQSEPSTWSGEAFGFRINDTDRRIEMELLAADDPSEREAMDARDIAAFGTTPLSDLTLAELDALHAEAMALKAEGIRVEKVRKEAKQKRVDDIFNAVTAPLQAKRKGKKGAIAGREDLKKQYAGFYGIVEKGVDWTYVATMGAQRLLDWMDGGRGKYNGAFVRYFGDMLNEARDNELREVFRRRDQMEAQLKAMGLRMSDFSKEVVVEGVTRENGQNFTRDQVMSIYAGMKNRHSRDAILYGNLAFYGDDAQSVANALIEQLTDTERAAADLVMRDYATEFGRINQAFVEAYNQGMAQEENYTPMRRLEFTSREGLLDIETGEAIMAAKENAGALGKEDAGFLHSRNEIGEDGQRAIDLGLFNIWLEQVDRQEHGAAFAGVLSDLRGVFRKTGESKQGLKNLIVETHGNAAWKALVNYYNVVARNSRAQADDVLDSASRWFGRSMSVAYLCGNLGTILKQTTSFPRVLAHAGPVHMGAALAEFSANPKAFLENVYSLDPRLRDRQGNLMARALRERGGTKGMADKAVNIGMEPIAAVDRWTAAVCWKAVYDASIARGLSNQTAMREAQRTVMLTQQTTHAKDAPLIWQQSGLAKLAMIFTSEAAQMWGMAVYDMTQSIRRGDVPAILANALTLTLTAAMFKMIVDGPPDDDEDETWEGWFASALSRQSLEAMPLIGKEVLVLWENTFEKPRYQGTQYSAFVAPLSKLGYGAKGLFDDNEDNDERAAWAVVEAMSLLGAPFPTTGVRRLWQSGGMAAEGDTANAAFNLFGMRGWIRD